MGRVIRFVLLIAVVFGALSVGGFLGPSTIDTNAGAQPNSAGSDPAEPRTLLKPADVATPAGTDTGEPDVVRVGFLINDIQDIDLARHRYQIDFYI